jgi:hypothetical protein
VMNIGLVDIDSKIPNLALLKLSAWHKGQGDTVELTTPVFASTYDKAYASQVFTWTQTPCLPEDVESGGTGIDLKTTLPDEVERMCPDYSLCNMDYSMGFLTRGCIRKCSFCFVPEKEGKIRPAADIEEFLRHKTAVLLDNNVLAHDHGIEQIEKIARLGIKVDFNQGLDARLIDDAIAERLAAVRWLKPIRLACDSANMKGVVEKAVKLLRKHGATPKTYFCYMLVEGDIDEAHDRAIFLRELGVDPFAMPYRSPNGNEVNKDIRNFARWVNHKEIFKSVDWEDYRLDLP